MPIPNILADSPYRPKNRCGLLVSVRNAQEAQLCLRCGVDVLDLKEPLAGALGTVPDTVIEQVRQSVMEVTPQRRPKLSFAVGELAEWDFQRFSRLLDRYSADQIAGFSYVKIGLAGATELADWRLAWTELFAGLPDSIRPVVVGYLDRQPDQVGDLAATEASSRGAPCPAIEQLIEFAQSQPQVSTILLDTFGKQSDLFASVDDRRLGQIIASAGQAGLATVVAGSVGVDSLPRVLQAGASLVGVRGAVCEGDRSGQLCEKKLIDFARSLTSDSQDSI